MGRCAKFCEESRSDETKDGYIHLLYPACTQLSKTTGKAAIVIPTGFITSKSGVEKRILQRIVDEKWVYGVVSMPSNVFATTGTNVSVIFFDKSASSDKVILIDASKLGEEYKEGNNQKRRLRDFEIDKIVNTFQNKETVDDFSVSVTYDEIKEKVTASLQVNISISRLIMLTLQRRSLISE